MTCTWYTIFYTAIMIDILMDKIESSSECTTNNQNDKHENLFFQTKQFASLNEMNKKSLESVSNVQQTMSHYSLRIMN